MLPATGSETSRDAALAAVDRVSAHHLFAESPRLCRFLRYVVEESLAGRKDGIKEYAIAVHVYGRPADFDPKTDATIRVEAGRLRSKLTRYYCEEGAADPIRITLPRGTYVPVIEQTAVVPGQPARGEQVERPRQTSLRTWAWVAVSLAAVVAATVAVLRYTGSPPQEVLSLAVLPLVNAAGDPEMSHLATGLVNELTDRISAEGGFRVAGRTDADRPGLSLSSIEAIGKALRVNAVLEGSVQRVSGGIRLTVQLIAAPSGFHVWSQTYQSLPGRTAEFQEKVTNLIARTLRARYSGVPASRFGGPPSSSEAAIALYFKGTQAWETQRKPGLLESIALYQQALRLDPRFAKAHEGLAASELFLASLESDRAEEHLALAKAEATRALEMDDRLEDAHARLGNIYLRREWRFVEAEAELKRSVTLSPGSSPITRWYAESARLLEKYNDARLELENGLLANPESEIIETELGLLELELDRLPEAGEHAARALAINAAYRLAHLLSGLIEQRRGNPEKAEQTLRDCSNDTELGRMCLAALGHVYGREQKIDDALEVARQLEESRGKSESLAAVVYTGLGDYERAFDALDRAFARRDKFLPLIKLDCRVQPLRRDYRYRNLMQRIGLPSFSTR